MALAAVLLTAAAFGGCNKNNGEGETSQTAETTAAAVTEAAQSESAAETSAPEDSEDKEEKAPPANKNLQEMSPEERDSALKNLVKLKDENGKNIFKRDTDASDFKTVSPNEVSVGEKYAADLYRSSTGLLCEQGDETFDKAAGEAKKSRHAKDLAKYEAVEKDVILKINYDDPDRPEIENVTSSYTLENVSFRGFAGKVKSDAYEIIIDPAYMTGIPMPLSCPDTYSVNGKMVRMDSISFTANGFSDYIPSDVKDYVYCGFTAEKLTVSYDKNGVNYSSAEGVVPTGIVYIDAAEAIDVSILKEKFENDSSENGAAETYRILLDNTDIFMSEDAAGIKLIDLDYDGSPEALVSRKIVDEGIDTIYGADVDIYTVKDGKPVLADTIHNYSSNFLSLKITDRLENKWYFESRGIIDNGAFYPDEHDKADYLFSFEDGKLAYTEVFRDTVTKYKDGSDMPIEWKYCFYGEEIVPDVKEENGETWYTCGVSGVAPQKNMRELYYAVKNRYRESLREEYSLYSGWLYLNRGDSYPGEKITPAESTAERMLAMLTDAFYYGEPGLAD